MKKQENSVIHCTIRLNIAGFFLVFSNDETKESSYYVSFRYCVCRARLENLLDS
jgi:hypothetical protein